MGASDSHSQHVLGRIGPLTLALYMAQSGETDTYRFAQERVTLG